MDPAPAAAPTPTAAGTPVVTGTSSSQAPVAYKIVKVKKADGTLATVKRKITPGEEATTSASGQETPADAAASSTPDGTPKYKIVTVRKADGTLVKVRRPITKPSEGAEKEKAAPKDADTQKVKPSPAAAEPKPAAPAAPAVVPSVPEDVKSNSPAAAKPTVDTKDLAAAKDSPAVPPATVEPGKPKAANGITEAKTDERGLADALADQEMYNREKRTHRFKSSLLRGLGMAVGSAIPSFEISNDFEEGDVVMSDDDDWSVDEGDDDDDDDDGHDISDELHASKEADHGTTGEADNSGSGPHVTFDAGAALGGLAATAAANAAAQPAPAPPPPAAARAAQNGTAAAAASDPEKEKHTYKISAKELADLEKATAEKVTEKKLNRHFANVTFYFMASLSIILPSLFLLLAGFIGGMRNKPATSSWSKMENPIKVAISAWPIVFAAVVAQCFKAWATFKVERGIKLMELEQLVGSSSFASAMKQPILLRRMDLLTIALFAVWCLSPIGSQALVRVYSTERQLIFDNTTVKYVPSFGDNRLFTPDRNYTKLADQKEYAEVVQLMLSYYVSALTPDPSTKTYISDPYLHPLLTDWTGFYPLQAYGALLTFPDSALVNDSAYNPTDSKQKANPNPKYEALEFTIPYSTFNFTCGPWQNRTRQSLNDMYANVTNSWMSWSESGTLGVAFTPEVLATGENMATFTDAQLYEIKGIRLASANSAHGDQGKKDDEQAWDDDSFQFSYIECSFKQEFQETDVFCYTEETTTTSAVPSDLPSCSSSGSRPLNAEDMARKTKDNMTRIIDFSDLLVAGNPSGDTIMINSPATLSEVFLQTGYSMSGDTKSSFGNMTLSVDIDTQTFASRFGYLFNTILGMGYCPECVNRVFTTTVDGQASFDTSATWTKLYGNVTADRIYARDLKYVVNPGWFAGFTVCAAILFVAGLAGVVVESMTVAPDVLGYVSTVARNSRYLQLPKVSGAMSGGERAKTVGSVKVMMQDVKGNANVGKIALGMKHEKAQRLVPGRLYR